MAAIKTEYLTHDGLRVYDLDPQAAELRAVAGPEGLDPASIDPYSLPAGCRWVEEEEWSVLTGEPLSVDPSEDASAPDLGAVWDALDSPIYLILDDRGVNTADARVRRLAPGYWLWSDSTEGYSVVAQSEIRDRWLVRPATYQPLGYRPDGSVTPM